MIQSKSEAFLGCAGGAIAAALGKGDRREVVANAEREPAPHSFAGALELAVCALVVHNGRIPPTINQFTPDPACDLDSAPNRAVERPVAVALSNSFGFGGHNVTLAVRRAA